MDLNYEHVYVTAAEELIAEGSAGGVQLKWDAKNNSNFFATEVWIGTLNDVSQASLYRTVRDNSVWVPLDPGTIRYFWIRHKDKAHQTSGFFPSTNQGIEAETPYTTLGGLSLNDPTSPFSVTCSDFDLTANRFMPPSTITATVGAVTMNTMTGRVNAAASATYVVVTNSNVSANSHVLAIPSNYDSTGRVVAVAPAAGSFTIYLTAPTAQMSIDYFVLG